MRNETFQYGLGVCESYTINIILENMTRSKYFAFRSSSRRHRTMQFNCVINMLSVFVCICLFR